MATHIWQGDASAVVQVKTLTLNNDTNDAETLLTVTLTAEDNTSTQTVSIVPTGVDESVIAAALHAALIASTQTLFSVITWTVLAGVITATADDAGVPFYVTAAYTAGTGTVTVGTTTANAGPHDLNTAANYDTGTVPVDGDDVLFNYGDVGAFYGLNQSAIDLKSWRRTSGYTGTIGQPELGYYLKIDVSDVTGSNVPEVHIDASNGGDTMLLGTFDDVYIEGLAIDATVKFGTGTDIANGTGLFVTGPGSVLGKVELADGIAIKDIYQTAHSSVIVAGDFSSVTGQFYLGAGSFRGDGDSASAFDVFGSAHVLIENTTTAATISTYGGSMDFRPGGATYTLSAVHAHGGITIVGSHTTVLTITNTFLNGGHYSERGGAKVIHTNPIKYRGGSYSPGAGKLIA